MNPQNRQWLYWKESADLRNWISDGRLNHTFEDVTVHLDNFFLTKLPHSEFKDGSIICPYYESLTTELQSIYNELGFHKVDIFTQGAQMASPSFCQHKHTVSIEDPYGRDIIAATSADGQNLVFIDSAELLKYILEFDSGAVPFFLEPVQLVLIHLYEPGCQKAEDYLKTIEKELLKRSVRWSDDKSHKDLRAMIKRHAGNRIPMLMIIGDREIEQQSINLRIRAKTDSIIAPLTKFSGKLKPLNYA